MIITGLDNCKAYIDYAIIYSVQWDEQLKTIREFFERLSKVSPLDQSQRKELNMLVLEHEHLFPDIQTSTDKIYHDVDVEGSKPVKQHPYRMNPMK